MKWKITLFIAAFLLSSTDSNAQVSPRQQLQQADALREAGAYEAANQAYRRLLSAEQSEITPWHRAYATYWLSETVYLQDSIARFRELAQTTLDIIDAHGELDTFSLLPIALQNVGFGYSIEGDYDAQMEYYLRSYKAALRINGRESRAMVDAYFSLGAAYGRRSNWSASIAYTDSSRIIAERLGYMHGVATALHNMAHAYAEKGDLERAVDLERRALQQAPPEYDRAKAYNSLGTYYTDLGQPGKALRYLDRALNLRKNKYGASHYYTWSTSLNIVYAKVAAGREAEAIRLLKEITENLEAQPYPAVDQLQIAYNYQAKLHYLTGDFKRASEIVGKAEAIGSKSNGICASTLMLRSNIECAQSRYRQAIRSAQQGLKQIAVQYNPQGLSDNPDWRTLEAIDHGWSLLLAKAQAEQGMGLNGQPQMLQQCLQTLLVADSLITDARQSYKSRTSRALMQSSTREVYELLVQVLYELHQLQPEGGYAARAFHFMEKNKALSVLENINELYARSFHDVPDHIVNQERSLREEIAFYDDLVRREEGDVEKWEQKLTDLHRERDSLLEYIRHNHKRYYQTRFSLYLAPLQQARKHLLREGETLLDYFLAGDELFVLLANEEKLNFFRWPAPGLLDDCLQLRRQTVSRDDVSGISQQIYEKVIAPLLPQLQGQRLLILPDGPLSYLPFDMLRPAKNAPYLIEDYSIRYLLSASTALQHGMHRAPQEEAGQILAFAPDFGSLNTTTRTGNKLSNLPGAQLELDSLQRLFTGRYLRGRSATEDAFRRRQYHRGVLHIATHAEVDDQFPSTSRLHFRGGGGQDGTLYAYELYNTSIAAELAFLSACETGFGALRPGEGSISLAHAFAYAGCPNLVMTLWPVRDRTTPELVAAFYRNLQRGMDKAEALRQAKLHCIRHDDLFAHPYFWSGFSYIGDRSPVLLLAASPGWHRYIGWAVLPVVILLILVTALRKPSGRA